MMQLSQYIENHMDTDYITDIRKARRKGAGGTQEFFTPKTLVDKMCDKIPESDWADPNKTFLEPSFGNGNFVVAMLERRILAGVDWKTALETMYGVELMEDNVQECHDRVISLLEKIAPDLIEETAREILKENLVCSDFFKWNFEEWRPYTEEEQKLTLKKK